VRPCLIHICHAVPLPCHEYAVLKANSQGHGRFAATERHGMCELASAVQRRHVGDLPAFGTDGEWQGRGRVAVGERHGMCESALRPRYHCDQYVFHFLLPYLRVFRGFAFRLEPHHRISAFSSPVHYIETRHKNHLFCTSVSLHGRVVTDLVCHTEDGIYRCHSHETPRAQIT
jgi:hypothetical protein